LGATLGEVFVDSCHSKDSFQSDSCLLDILEQMGASLVWKDSGLFVQSPDKLLPLNWECSNCPDLVPTLAYLCSYAEGESRLKNVKILRHKESDRILELEKILGLFGVSYLYNEALDELVIFGKGLESNGVEFKKHHPAKDHRMVMVTYLFMRKNQGGEVFNASHVKKSFPRFFEEMK
jgi:3-phosphoshikimate 1-carboxyvinyltransferase